MTQVAKLTELMRNESLPVPRESFKSLAATIETNEKTVAAVAVGLALSMRRDDRVAVVARLSAELEFCARTYCGADVSTEEDLLDEAVSFVLKRFAQLGVGEVREAFSLAAAGDLGNVDIRAYYGRFSLVVLGEVLKSYLEFRNKIVHELRKAEAKAAEAATEVEKAARKSESLAEHADWCANKLAFYLLNGSPIYNLIPLPLYDFLVETGAINLTKEAKWELMERAKPLVITSYMEDIRHSDNEFDKRKYRRILDEYRNGKNPVEFTARQKVVARELAVLDYIDFHKIEENATATGTD